MISAEREAEILRLFHAEKWKVGTVASQLGVHHTTVQRVLAQHGVARAAVCPRPSIADPFVPFIVETLTKFPLLRASRLHQMARERGYKGAPDHFRRVVARYRPRPPAEAFLRLRTLPGEQAQVDWGHFGKLRIGQAQRELMAFVMVLSWSRQVFLRFYLGHAMPAFLRGHVEAFAFFGGVPRVMLYDNLKSAVLERLGDAIRFHPTLLELTRHYHFEPRPVAKARGNEKGRVERKIRDVRDSFFAAREFSDISDLNVQALAWSTDLVGDRRCPEDRTRSVREAFADERPRLLPLPPEPFPCHQRTEVEVGKTPYVRFDLNDYSVPAELVRRSLVVVADLDTVCVHNGPTVVAHHRRSWDRGRQIEDPAHIEALVAIKARAREARGLDRLTRAAPSARTLLERAAEKGGNLGNITARLLALLDVVSPDELEAAIVDALAHDACHVGAVRQVLDRQRSERGLPPPVTARFSQHSRTATIVVRPHPLGSYDHLHKESSHDD